MTSSQTAGLLPARDAAGRVRGLRSSWYISISSVDVACRVEFCRDGPGTAMLTRMILVQEPLDVAVEACTHVSRIDVRSSQ